MTPAELDEAIAPVFWRGAVVALLLILIGTVVLFRGTKPSPSPRIRSTSRERTVLALLTLIALAFRMTVMFRPIDHDEALNFVFYVSRSLMVALTFYGSPNNHTLNTILVRLMWSLFGDAEWALRIPALLAGLALIPLTWLTSKKLGHDDGALLAAGCAAGMPVLIDYSTEARGYTFVAMFALIALAAAADLASNGGRRVAATFAIAVALGFYTIPVMLYPLAAIVVWLALSTRHRRDAAIAVAAAALFTAALLSPMISVSSIGAIVNNKFVQPLPFRVLLESLPRFAAEMWARWMAGIPIVLQIVIAIGLVTWRGAFPRARFAAAIALILLVIAQRIIPYPRLWVPLTPMLLIVAASAWRWPRYEILAAVGLAVVLGIAWRIDARPRDTGELPHVIEIARELKLRVRPGDAVAAGWGSDLPLAFYFLRYEVPADVLHPDVAHAQRMWVVCNYSRGMDLPHTLSSLHIDPRPFALAGGKNYGESAIALLVRREP